MRRQGFRLAGQTGAGSSPGQGLVELVIAIAIVGLVMTALASGLTYSVKISAESKLVSIATERAQQAVEMFRRERNTLGWSAFHAALPTANYCLPTLPANSTEFEAMSAGPCGAGDTMPDSPPGASFTRLASVWRQDDGGFEEIRLRVRVSWQEGARTRQVEVWQEFRDI
ncbi:MAG: hypothetical protein COU69_00940 [Candidatus Pacebacteria bacterium CG10_big_fil_rev_8_21_14_0_10_56_10]|nr:MAG: hypothetical protein COU69_00940 [Candidatus Pacebacteria bacterium CG10_big_fil_rev_8_21_14_0_10_56_10]